MNKIFFSQRIIDAPTDEGTIKLDGNVIMLLTPDKPSFDAETYLDSVIYEDTVYEVEPGFIGEKKELIDRLSDSELLARLLLDTLL